MKVEIIKCLQDNYSYIILDEKNQIACVIDPSEAQPIINFVEEKKIQLKYILNTHHHYDHIGGNEELKKKYNSKIVGFKEDRNRIPGINEFVENNQIWKADNFEAKIFHVPGHTSGHIAYHFYKEKKIFTGDTLFSLGCGRIFEGTYEEMFNSLNKIKNLSDDTEIYCGHEYTLQNSKFCITFDSENQDLIKKIHKIKEQLKRGEPTLPSTLEDELKSNIFLRSHNSKIKTNLNINNSSSIETFSKLRDLKDNF